MILPTIINSRTIEALQLKYWFGYHLQGLANDIYYLYTECPKIYRKSCTAFDWVQICGKFWDTQCASNVENCHGVLISWFLNLHMHKCPLLDTGRSVSTFWVAGDKNKYLEDIKIHDSQGILLRTHAGQRNRYT